VLAALSLVIPRVAPSSEGGFGAAATAVVLGVGLVLLVGGLRSRRAGAWEIATLQDLQRSFVFRPKHWSPRLA
jgi:hypothetical protein